MTLSNFSKFKLLAPKFNEKFELPDVPCSVSDIQDYFKHIIKKQEKLTDNHPIRIYVNQIKNRVPFRRMTRYYL